MKVPFRLFLSVGLVAVTATVLVSCGGDDSSTSATTTTKAKATTTTASSGDSGGGTSSSGDTAKVRFINVWGGDPNGGPIDLYQSSGVDKYSKVVTGLVLGQASDWTDLDVTGGAANLQVTKSGEQPDKAKFSNNVQVNNVDPGQSGVTVIGWDPKGGPDSTGGTQFQSLNLGTDDLVKPVDGKVKVHASLTGADRDSTVFLAVVGKGCLGEDGLNEPSVEFDPGAIQIQGIRSDTSTGGCAGEVQIPPVSIDGTAGSSWIVALYGPATAQKLAALDVTP